MIVCGLAEGGETTRLTQEATFVSDGNSESASCNLNTHNRNLYIRSNDAKQKFFDGVIDEVAIYNRTHTAEEIIELKERC